MKTRRPDHPTFEHGSAVAAMISGPKLGICKNCQVRFVVTGWWMPGDAGEKWARGSEAVLAQLVAVLDEIKGEGREGRAVVNMSFGTGAGLGPVGFYEAFRKLSPLTKPSPCVQPFGKREFLTWLLL
jgi:hypothetical protein